jgi:hypothetical protein
MKGNTRNKRNTRNTRNTRNKRNNTKKRHANKYGGYKYTEVTTTNDQKRKKKVNK